MKPTILLTGGNGFIGSHFIGRANDIYNIRSISREEWDFRSPWDISKGLPESPDCFIHFGANVNARLSVGIPAGFITNNIVGTFNVLELARVIRPKLFVYISSAEALGGCDSGYLDENAPLRPSNPYAASKAAGELLTQTYFRCYDLPAITVRTQCVWDMDQWDKSKAVPIMIEVLISGKPVKIYSRRSVPGYRQWIRVNDFCDGLILLLPQAVPGEIYHIVGIERSNLAMAQLLAENLGITAAQFETQEILPTHEWRYAIRNTKVLS